MGVFDDFKKNITAAFANLPLTAELGVGAVFGMLSGKTLDQVVKEEDKNQSAQFDIESMLGDAPSGKGMFSPVAEHDPDSLGPVWDYDSEQWMIKDDFGNMVPAPEPVSFPMDPSLGRDADLMEEMLGLEGQGGLTERLNLMAMDPVEEAPPATLEEMLSREGPVDRDTIAQILYGNDVGTYDELRADYQENVDDVRSDILDAKREQRISDAMGAVGSAGNILGDIRSGIASPFKKYLELSGISGPPVPMVAPSGPSIGAADALTEEMMGFEDPRSLIQNLTPREIQELSDGSPPVPQRGAPWESGPAIGDADALTEEMMGFEDPVGSTGGDNWIRALLGMPVNAFQSFGNLRSSDIKSGLAALGQGGLGLGSALPGGSVREGIDRAGMLEPQGEPMLEDEQMLGYLSAEDPDWKYKGPGGRSIFNVLGQAGFGGASEWSSRVYRPYAKWRTRCGHWSWGRNTNRSTYHFERFAGSKQPRI